MISVVMGVHNGADDLECTVKSICDQSIRDIEIVLVNDGSDLKTSTLIDLLAAGDSRIRVITKRNREGLTAALIDGCNEARGDYIARIDNGDIMVPGNRLEIQAGFLRENPDYVLTSGAVVLVATESGRIYRSRTGYISDGDIRGRYARHKTAIAHMTVMMRRDAYHKSGGYNPQRKTGQDTDLWPRLISLGKAEVKDQIYAIATMRPDSISVRRNTEQYWHYLKLQGCEMLDGNFSWSRAIRFCSVLLRLSLPLRIRLYLMWRKNYRYLGRLDKQSRSLESIMRWYEKAVEKGVV